MSGLKPYSMPSHLMDMSVDTDAPGVVFKVGRELEGWEGRRRSCSWESGVGSLICPTAFAGSAQLKQASSEYINSSNMILIQDFFWYKCRIGFGGMHAEDPLMSRTTSTSSDD